MDENTKKSFVGLPKGRQVDQKANEQIDLMFGELPKDRQYLIEYLHKIQDTYHHLSISHLNALANHMAMAQTEVYEVASFYHHFIIVREDEIPPPTPIIRVCSGISCALAGSDRLHKQI